MNASNKQPEAARHWYAAPAAALDLLAAAAVALSGNAAPKVTKHPRSVNRPRGGKSYRVGGMSIGPYAGETHIRCTADQAMVLAGILKRGRPFDYFKATNGDKVKPADPAATA